MIPSEVMAAGVFVVIQSKAVSVCKGEEFFTPEFFEMIIHWFRRDLRLTDNTALHYAIRDANGPVLPVYIQSGWTGEHRWTGAARQEFLCGSLAALASEIGKAGVRLIVRRGEADEELRRLATETRARAIYFNRDPDPFGRQMEQRVIAVAQELGIEVKGFHDVTVHAADAVLTGNGTPFRVYTPYSKAWLKLVPTKPARRVTDFGWKTGADEARLAEIDSLPLPNLKDWGLRSMAEILEPGEPAARRLMERFFRGPVLGYGEARDIPALNATSRFSAALRWGLLSARELLQRCHAAMAETRTAEERKSVQRFLGELIWREFYMAILWHHPEVLEYEFQPKFRGTPWLYPGQRKPAVLREFPLSPVEAFRRWCDGETGFPIIDAGMRQLAATGFMHNRVRMIVAMFLTKDLHLDWRLGEQFFMQKLVDGEIASNNGGWQWSAGTGADAAPYFRIQNPWSQAARFDPDGEYIKTWVPELRDLPAKVLTAAPAHGTRLTRKYPEPMVDHAEERARTLEVFSRGSEAGTNQGLLFGRSAATA
jgi:deoxyribodipyrimidine photo-lyase